MPKFMRVLLMLSLAMVSPMSLVACGDDESSDDNDAAVGDGDGDGDAATGDGDGDGDAATGDGDGDGDGSTAACDLDALEDGGDIPNPIDADVTLESGMRYKLDGTTHVPDGVTLTVEPCVRIEGLGAEDVLVVSRGGKIMAEGEADKPILFTSQAAAGQRASGNWGGLVLLGRAPNWKGDSVLIEGLDDEEANYYGGTDAAHDCGTLAYVRVEFSGVDLGGGNEVNGLTFGSCGTGTDVHHVMVNNTLDDGYEWFGGGFDAHHLVTNNVGDDMFDADQGFTGELSFLFGRQGTTDSEDPNGFEMDSKDTADETPITTVTIANATLCGTGADNDPDTTKALKLRENLHGSLDAVFASGFDYGIDLEDDFGTVAAPLVTVANSVLFDMNLALTEDDGDDLVGGDDDNIIEADWFSMGTDNSETAPAYSNDDCLAADGPNATLTGSDTGAFEGDADWLSGMWVDWSVD